MRTVVRLKRKWRIGKHEVKCRIRGAVEKSGDILLANRSREPGLREVGADGGVGLAMAIHKSTRSRPPAERLDAKRAAPGKKIEDTRSGHGVAEA